MWISCFYRVLSKTLSYIIYINKNITNTQPRFRGQVEVNQPCYYTPILMITTTKSQKLDWQSFKHNGTCKIKYYYHFDSIRIIRKWQEVAIRVSYYIYCRRNKISSDPELMSYTNGFKIKIYPLLVITSLVQIYIIYIYIYIYIYIIFIYIIYVNCIVTNKEIKV